MTTTPMPTRPGGPDDPDRYARDAWEQREARRREDVRATVETPPSHTPVGPIRVIAGLVALALVAIAGFSLIGPMLRQSETTEQSLSGDISSLQLKNGVGDVRVRVAEAGERPKVSVTAEWGLRRPSTTVDVSGDRATLRGDCPSAVSVCSTEWLVVVPEGTDLDVEQGVGGITAEGVDGDLDISGGVGDIDISDSTSQRIDVEYGVGGVRIESVEPPREIRARIGVGDLSVAVPSSVPYRVDTTGGASEVRNALGSDTSASRRLVLEAGVGGITVEPS